MKVSFSFFAGVATFILEVASLGVGIIIRDAGAFSSSVAEVFFWSIFSAGAGEEFSEALPDVGPACG